MENHLQINFYGLRRAIVNGHRDVVLDTNNQGLLDSKKLSTYLGCCDRLCSVTRLSGKFPGWSDDLK